jgi:hypothetical protein
MRLRYLLIIALFEVTCVATVSAVDPGGPPPVIHLKITPAAEPVPALAGAAS